MPSFSLSSADGALVHLHSRTMGAVALIRAPLWYNQQGKAGFTKAGGKDTDLPRREGVRSPFPSWGSSEHQQRRRAGELGGSANAGLALLGHAGWRRGPVLLPLVSSTGRGLCSQSEPTSRPGARGVSHREPPPSLF